MSSSCWFFVHAVLLLGASASSDGKNGIDYEVTIQGEWTLWINKVPKIEVETHKVGHPDIVVPTLTLCATRHCSKHKPLVGKDHDSVCRSMEAASCTTSEVHITAHSSSHVNNIKTFYVWTIGTPLMPTPLESLLCVFHWDPSYVCNIGTLLLSTPLGPLLCVQHWDPSFVYSIKTFNVYTIGTPFMCVPLGPFLCVHHWDTSYVYS